LTSSSLERIEHDLRGHVKGAYSGAESNRAGCIANAAGGTLYLDEVGELPVAGQLLLLRLLEEGRYTAIGSDIERASEARVVLSTNQDVRSKMSDGTIRADLYYRMTSGLTLHVPPLRDRPEDVPSLVIARAREAGVTFSTEIVSAFARLHYPGNVRELLGAVDRVIAIADGHQVDAALVARCAPVPIAPGSSPRAPSEPIARSTAGWIPSPSEQPDDPDALADRFFALHGYRFAPAKEHLIRRGLAKTGHNMSKCARLLEVGYPVVRRAASGDKRGEFDA
jgi:DNA-binding NtrC family response regulator